MYSIIHRYRNKDQLYGSWLLSGVFVTMGLTVTFCKISSKQLQSLDDRCALLTVLPFSMALLGRYVRDSPQSPFLSLSLSTSLFPSLLLSLPLPLSLSLSLFISFSLSVFLSQSLSLSPSPRLSLSLSLSIFLSLCVSVSIRFSFFLGFIDNFLNYYILILIFFFSILHHFLTFFFSSIIISLWNEGDHADRRIFAYERERGYYSSPIFSPLCSLFADILLYKFFPPIFASFTLYSILGLKGTWHAWGNFLCVLCLTQVACTCFCKVRTYRHGFIFISVESQHL